MTRSRSIQVLVALSTALVLVVAACTGTAPTGTLPTGTFPTAETPPTVETSPTEETPDLGGAPTGRKGTLRVGITVDVESFDPFSRAAPQWPIVQNIYDTLIRYTPDQEPVAGLAQSWEFADDNSAVTLILQPDAVWHTGGPVTASDIVQNFERARTEETGAHMFTVTSPISDVTAVDEATVEIRFEEPTPPRAITDMLQQLAMIEPEYFDRLDSEASGTGPFMLESWNPGSGFTLVANEEYWDEGPFVERVEFTIFPDTDAMISAMQGGSIDLATDVPGRNADALSDSAELVLGAPGSLVYDIRINTAAPPFDNQVVRQALTWHAVDREGIVEAVLFGYSVPSITPFDAGPFMDIDYYKNFPYDLDRAREMLDAEGIDLSGEAVEILVDTRFPEVLRISEIIQASWEQLGLDITLVPGDAVFDRYLEGDFQVLPSITANGNKYPLVAFGGSLYRPEDNPAWEGGTPPQEWIDIRDDLATAFTPDEQQAVFDRLLDFFIQQAWGLTVADRTTIFALAPGVTGFDFTVDSMPVFQRVRVTN